VRSITDEFRAAAGSLRAAMKTTAPHPVVHLELHTGDIARACEFYGRLFGWRNELIEPEGCSSYRAIDMGGVGGGVVECETGRSLWLPYVEVGEVRHATEHAQDLGASVLLEPREGPAGWRSVVASPAGAEIAFWQQKR
jgi:predicted enzyme related to lactoylglutathione lyase